MDGPSNLELVNLLLSHLNRITFLNNNSLNAELSRRTAAEAAEYIMKNMDLALSFDEPSKLMHFAMGKAERPGLVMEFGVYKGESINQISAFFEDRTVFGFDSFEGLKEDWRGHHNTVAGTFDLGGVTPEVNSNVRLVKGWFDQSLPGFLSKHADIPIAFMHIDSDTYEAAETILESTGKRLLPGTVIVFDEYLNYRGWRNGEFKAWQEFCARSITKYEYLGFCIHGEQVAIRITQIGATL